MIIFYVKSLRSDAVVVLEICVRSLDYWHSRLPRVRGKYGNVYHVLLVSRAKAGKGLYMDLIYVCYKCIDYAMFKDSIVFMDSVW